MKQHSCQTRRYLLRTLCVLATAVLLLPACESYFPEDPIIVRDEVVGLRATYIAAEDARMIELVQGDNFVGDGLPVELTDFTLVPTGGEGLTVRTKGAGPGAGVATLRIPGFAGVTAVIGNHFTFDSYADRVSIRLDALDRFTLISRERDRRRLDPYEQLRDRNLADGFDALERNYDGSYFLECVDTTAGYVLTWAPVTLRKPQCRFR